MKKVKKINFWIMLCVRIACLGVLIFSHTYAAGTTENELHPYIATDILYDSNLLRVSDTDSEGTTRKNKSDFIQQLRAGLDIDWNISRQHFLLKGEANHSWFQRFDELNYVGWDTLAQWNWQAGEFLNGEMGYSNRQFLGEFTQINGLVSNLQNLQNYFANADYLFHANGKVEIGWFRNKLKFDDNSRAFSNSIEDNAEFKLQYLSPTGSTLGIRYLSTFGDFPDREFTANSFLDNGYLRMNYSLIGRWQWSSKMSVEGEIGYTDQEHDHLRNRDFSDITGNLYINWAASEKILFLVSGWREIRQSYDILSNFILTQGVNMVPTWKATPKIEINLPLSYERQEFLGNSNITGLEQQKDKIYSAAINLLYRPFDSTSIGLLLQYEKKDSNFILKSYEDASVGLNMQMVF
jgi:exopolysaccharide biosynthesis operon protein EpsL